MPIDPLAARTWRPVWQLSRREVDHLLKRPAFRGIICTTIRANTIPVWCDACALKGADNFKNF